MNSSEAAAPETPVAVPVETRIAQWKMRAADLRDEMNQDHRVLRLRPPSDPLPQYTMPDAMEAYIRQHLQADPVVGALDIGVDVDRVVVTLTGKAASLEVVGRAMAVALDTPGISEVISEMTLPEPAAGAGHAELPHG